MRFAIPVVNGLLSMHFGHCSHFGLIDVDDETKSIQGIEYVDAPAHQPGLLPRWLAERQAHVIISGGMGARAQQLFSEQGIKVVVGAPSEAPETLVESYLQGTLVCGGNVCDH